MPSASTNAEQQERNSIPSPQTGKKESEPEPSKQEPESEMPPEPEPEPVMTSKPEPEPVNEPPKLEPVKEVKTNGSHTVGEESTDSAITEDSYEARRRARQKAREAKKKASQEAKNKPEEKMTYKQKREEELKKNAQSSSAQQQPRKTAPLVCHVYACVSSDVLILSSPYVLMYCVYIVLIPHYLLLHVVLQ